MIKESNAEILALSYACKLHCSVLISKFSAHGSGHVLERKFTKFREIMQRPLCCSFKVTDFGTTRKFIYDFLLVIILTYLRSCTVSKFSLPKGECLTLTLSLGMIPANIAIRDISLKTTFFWLHFCCRKYRCILNHVYIIHPERERIRWNYAAVRAITPFKVIQGHRFWYQSKAHMRLPISD